MNNNVTILCPKQCMKCSATTQNTISSPLNYTRKVCRSCYGKEWQIYQRLKKNKPVTKCRGCNRFLKEKEADYQLLFNKQQCSMCYMREKMNQQTRPICKDCSKPMEITGIGVYACSCKLTKDLHENEDHKNCNNKSTSKPVEDFIEKKITHLLEQQKPSYYPIGNIENLADITKDMRGDVAPHAYNAMKYITRHHKKHQDVEGQLKDLDKAIHSIEIIKGILHDNN